MLLYLFIWRIVRTAEPRPPAAPGELRARPAAGRSRRAPAGAAAAAADGPPRRDRGEQRNRNENTEVRARFHGCISIGRGGPNDVRLDGDDYASANHARVEPRRDGVWIEDVGIDQRHVRQRRPGLSRARKLAGGRPRPRGGGAGPEVRDMSRTPESACAFLGRRCGRGAGGHSIPQYGPGEHRVRSGARRRRPAPPAGSCRRRGSEPSAAVPGSRIRGAGAARNEDAWVCHSAAVRGRGRHGRRARGRDRVPGRSHRARRGRSSGRGRRGWRVVGAHPGGESPGLRARARGTRTPPGMGTTIAVALVEGGATCSATSETRART